MSLPFAECETCRGYVIEGTLAHTARGLKSRFRCDERAEEMSDGWCTCPATPFPDDPYYQCSFCEQQQEDAQRQEDLEMTEHRIFLEARPATRISPAIPSGYFGPVPGVGMNEFIYCRVSYDKLLGRRL